MDRITDKKLNNKKFRKSEEATLDAFFLAKNYLSIKRITQIAHISRSTIYRHHGSVTKITENYEVFILKRYKKTIYKLLKTSTIRQLYRRTLIFIVANKKIVQFLYQFGDRSTFEKMVYCLKPKIIVSHKISNDEMFKIYAKEITCIIEDWAQKDYKIDDIPAVVSKIMYLTDTARVWLSPITSQK